MGKAVYPTMLNYVICSWSSLYGGTTDDEYILEEFTYCILRHIAPVYIQHGSQKPSAMLCCSLEAALVLKRQNVLWLLVRTSAESSLTDTHFWRLMFVLIKLLHFLKADLKWYSELERKPPSTGSSRTIVFGTILGLESSKNIKKKNEKFKAVGTRFCGTIWPRKCWSQVLFQFKIWHLLGNFRPVSKASHTRTVWSSKQ